MEKIDMKELIFGIKLFGAGMCASLTSFLGGWDVALKVLVTFVVLDVITGFLGALYHKKVSSNVTFKGGIRKIGIFVIVGVATLLDILMNTEVVLRTLAIGYYIGHEGISIAENWAGMDLPLPSFIKEALVQLRNKSDKGDDGNENST